MCPKTLDPPPRVGKTFNGIIHRIDDSGNGIIETKESHINVGPVTDDAVGEWVEALKLPGGYARLNTRKVRPDNYFDVVEQEWDFDFGLNPKADDRNTAGSVLGKRKHKTEEKYAVLDFNPKDTPVISKKESEDHSELPNDFIVIGETYTTEIDRVSNSGNGMVYVKDREFNLGSVDAAPASVVEVEIIDGQRAECLTELALSDDEGEEKGEEDGEGVDTGSTESDERDGENVERDVKPGEEQESESSAEVEAGAEVDDSSVSESSAPSVDLEADLEELRREAELDAEEDVTIETTTTRSVGEYSRSSKIRRYVKARAGGVCEGCGSPAPFTGSTGEPYLHAHHVHELSDGGSDTPDTVIALCPNCHYRVHHGEDGEEYNNELIEKLEKMES